MQNAKSTVVSICLTVACKNKTRILSPQTSELENVEKIVIPHCSKTASMMTFFHHLNLIAYTSLYLSLSLIVI